MGVPFIAVVFKSIVFLFICGRGFIHIHYNRMLIIFLPTISIFTKLSGNLDSNISLHFDTMLLIYIPTLSCETTW